MLQYSFMAEEARKACRGLYAGICDLLIGQKKTISIDRYLVYPTYFRWLFDHTIMGEPDILLATHTGKLIDFAPKAPMWEFLKLQEILVKQNRLEAKRLVILTSDDIALERPKVEAILMDLIRTGMKLYVVREQTAKKYFTNKGKYTPPNWAIYGKRCPNGNNVDILLQYSEKHGKFHDNDFNRLLTLVSIDSDKTNGNKNKFESLMENRTGQDLCFHIEDDTYGKEEELKTFLDTIYQKDSTTESGN